MLRHLTKDDFLATLSLLGFALACAALWMELPA